MKSNAIIAVIAFSMAMSVLISSCNEENVVEPSNDIEAQTGEVTLTPRTLATIELEGGTTVVFRSEEDGVVYEVSSPYDDVDFLSDASILEKFLALTDDSTPVPEDLLLINEIEELRNQAIRRGLTKQIDKIVRSEKKVLLKNARTEGACSGGYYYDTDSNGQYYRTFYGYPWYPSITVWSSAHQGLGRCKTIKLNLTNCSLGYTIYARTYYKNVSGNYKHQNTISIGPQDGSGFWSKTYTSKRYRKVVISGNSPFEAHDRVSGYVLFTNYQ